MEPEITGAWKPAERSLFPHWQFLQASATKDVPHFLASMIVSPHPTPALAMWLMSLLASINDSIDIHIMGARS